MIQISKVSLVWSKGSLVLGFLLAAMMAALVLTAKPAQASLTYTVKSTGDRPDTSVVANGFCDTDTSRAGSSAR